MKRLRLPSHLPAPIVTALAFGLVGCLLFAVSHASTPTTNSEAEDGAVSSCASTVTDTSASGGSAVKFGGCTGGADTNPSADAGASLPISYSLSSLSGTVTYLATIGSDSGSGTVSSPYATLAKAISATPSGGTIVVRGGTYRQGGVTISKSLKIIAYPGETPIFNGAVAVSDGWSTSGSLSYRTYTAMPVTDGEGISFTDCEEQTSSCVGKYPDQVWLPNGQQLQQVASQADVATGKFYVDSSNNRLYVTTSDASQGTLEVSSQRKLASVSAANVTIEGVEIIRYSNTASDYGVITYTGSADNSLLKDVYISDAAFVAVDYTPTDSDLNVGSTIQDSTIRYSNWMGVGTNGTTSFTLDHDDINNMNFFNEFTASPQSGALKTGRTWYTKVVNSKITDNKSHGLWFDQSNYMVDVAGNDIENNTGAALFFEISDYLYAANNYFNGNGRNSIEVSGSSDAYIVNNTFVGSGEQLGVYVDGRSVAGCSDPDRSSACSGSYGSDVDKYHSPHPATMTWIPSVNLIVDNIFAYPSGSGYCGLPNLTMCITENNGDADVDISTIIHHADTDNNIPQTVINGNVYADNTSKFISTVQIGDFSSLSAFISALAGSPVSISGMESKGLTGTSYVNTDGSPTSSLAALHSSAYAVPTESHLNTYIPAGTKHYGVLWK